MTNVDTVTKWEALRELRVAAKAALAWANAVMAANAPTPENAKALGDRFEAMVTPAFRKALDAGVPREEAMRVIDGTETAAAVNRVMATTVSALRRQEHEDEAARRANAAEVALRAARRRALRRLQLVAAARADADWIDVAALVIALRNAVEAGVPLDAACDFLEQAGVPHMAILGAALADSRARAADAEAGVRPAIPLPEPVRDHGEAVAPDADAHVQSASPNPELALDASESEADLRSIDGAAAAIGATFTESERRIAARAVNQLRTLACRMTERAERHWQALGAGRVLRRQPASRAPRRAVQRGAVALTRDGPPPSDDVPAPVARRSPHGAIGGPR